MAPRERIELPPRDLETLVLPLHQRGNYLVVGVPGVEPGMFTTWGRGYSPAVHTP